MKIRTSRNGWKLGSMSLIDKIEDLSVAGLKIQGRHRLKSKTGTTMATRKMLPSSRSF